MLTRILIILSLLLGTVAAAFAQDSPVDIPKKELPKKAHCAICSAQGSGEGEESVAAGVRYKGKVFYFCSASEVAKFKQDPDSWIPLPLPRAMPEFSLKSLTGERISQTTHKGKVLLVDFWATWCKPCVETMPDLQKLSAKYTGKDLVILGVSIDDKGEKVVRPFIEKRKFTYPILLDTPDKPIWQKFGVKAVPALFLVDKNGQIVRQWTGKPNKKEVEQAVQDLLK